MKTITTIGLLLAISLLPSCLYEMESDLKEDVSDAISPQEVIENLVVSDNFNYETTNQFELNIQFELPNGTTLSSVPFTLVDSAANQENVILNGVSNPNGKSKLNLTLGAHIEKIWLKINFVGLPTTHEILLENSVIYYNVNEYSHTKKSVLWKRTTGVESYNTLGGWNSLGVPDYLLATDDNVDQQLLIDINVSLPEGAPVPSANPQYLKDIDMNTRLNDEADLWVTFVHEGAGYKNTLGFFTYNLASPPTSISEVPDDQIYIIFPNVSFNNSGGGLYTGNKVYLGRFPANTGIGWFLIPNGWNSGTQSVQPSFETKYSIKSMNDYAGEAYRQYLIQLRDDKRELLLLGFEDITRPGGDNDFNDAIFYVTANPYSAITTDELESISTSVDSDNDGIHDYADEFPADPSRAISQYTPSKNRFGSLAFEDLWPSKGDYDFNDLVLDYNVRSIMNANYMVKELEFSLKVKAIGALYQNGFGIELPISSDKIQSVEGTFLNEGFVEQNSNGCELGHEKAVIVFFENASKLLPRSPESNYTNVERGKQFVEPLEFIVKVTLQNGVFDNELTGAPYNPFLIVNKNREQEIHLSGHAPTTKINTALFGKKDDRTNLSSKFYKTENNLPWAIHTPVSFDYPSEGKVITQSHLKFAQWAESGGSIYNDWYQSQPNYRHEVMIFKK
ncbi:LruC domain-containing protein [Flammeovirgaceae bacterium SG7u.111]|nr:LruC domain-containing protein [Flammeovirgaceae bacterium SG7u.132]WPO34553.1 LruC domain-containing protein [Flammeovirgaceae bacterium SG7u.111]